MLKNPRIILVLTLLIVIPFIAYNLLASNQNRVLSEKTTTDQSALTFPSSSPSPSSLPATTPPSPTKSSYTIAAIGDSMVDTMGENLPYLAQTLASLYPQTNFHLYNYGIGSQNVAEGLSRFDKSYTNNTRSYPPLPDLAPDIIIVGSFSYNPFSPHNPDEHWLKLTELVKRAQTVTPRVYLLSEIAPLSIGFGQGPGGPNWPPQDSYQQAVKITEQLENTVSLAKNLNVELINAFETSKKDKRFGENFYVSGHDGIHPSQEGHYLMAQLIAKALKL